MFAFRALMFSRGHEVKEVRGPQVDRTEMDRTLKKFVGMPITLEHELPKVPLGKVLSVHIDDTGDGYVEAFISTETERGRIAAEQVRAGVIRGVSFGANATFIEETGQRFSDYEPHEVSLVTQGEEVRSRIVGSLDRDHIWLHSSGIQEVLGLPQMATAAAPTTTPPAAPPAIPGISQVDLERFNVVMNALRRVGYENGDVNAMADRIVANHDRLNSYEKDANTSMMQDVQTFSEVVTDLPPETQTDFAAVYRDRIANNTLVRNEVSVLAAVGKSYKGLKDANLKFETENAALKARLGELEESQPKKAKHADIATKPVLAEQTKGAWKANEELFNAFLTKKIRPGES